MPRYRVTMTYRMEETFEVEAEDEADARRRVDEGDGVSLSESVVPGSTTPAEQWVVTKENRR